MSLPDYQIELYRGMEPERFGSLPFMPVVRQSLERLLRWDLSQANIRVTVVAVPDELVAASVPVIENVIPDYGYAYVKIYQGTLLLYQHPHPLSDIMTQTLQAILQARYPQETLWRFRLDIPGMPQQSATRPTPAVEGGVVVQPYSRGEKPAFGIRRLAEPEPPARVLTDFVATPGSENLDAPVKVLIHPDLSRELLEKRALSHEVEEGGFLIGRAYRDEAADGAYLIEVADALTADHTGASLLHFTFTGDSFVNVKQTLRQSQPDLRMVGWYHTHLFPATPDFGLSSIDFKLHFGTFTIPWQLAGLINLDGDKRTLRFYSRKGDEMIQCPYWLIDERC